MKKAVFSFLALLLAVITLYGFYFKPNTMMIHHGWARSAPPNSPMAGYFELHNHSDQDYHLVGASSDDFATVMVHRSYEESGVAKMSHVDEVAIQQGENLDFAPGGFHLMLMKRNRDFEIGDKTSVVLRFKNGSEMHTDLEVKAMDGKKHNHSDH
ncbi:MAG: copper chaperone PCu(A)C [Gammaproteobacteria bacterium]|nr:copper chaperone PCu(A)C [Gammaproteobacteria bacterium]